MNKQWEPERSRVEHANDARITFTTIPRFAAPQHALKTI